MSFDRVADIYDATRAIPDDVLQRIVERTVAATGATEETRFLELGIGTGRIALPFIRAGFPYIGVDISERMIARLREKLPPETPGLELLQADVTRLPLADDSVDVVLTVHVLHLVSDWRLALNEAQRVLRPGGYFVMGRNWSRDGDPDDRIRAKWRQLVQTRGVALRPDNGTWDGVDAELTARGGKTAVYRVAGWAETFRPIDLLRAQRDRVFSYSWDVPDAVLAEVSDELLRWVRDEYGDPEAPLDSHEEFLLSITTFDTAA